MHAQTDRAGADTRLAASVRARAVVVAGPPASGKTTLGAALARVLHHTFIDLDIVTGAMTRAALALAGADETALDGALGARLRDARYGALLDTAAANLDLGLGVVLSGPFTRERPIPRAGRRSAGGSAARTPRSSASSSTSRPAAPAWRRAAPHATVRSCACLSLRAGPDAGLPAGAIRLDGGGDPEAVLEAALRALADHPHPC